MGSVVFASALVTAPGIHRNLATPKSSSFARLAVNITFAGFRSRYARRRDRRAWSESAGDIQCMGQRFLCNGTAAPRESRRERLTFEVLQLTRKSTPS